MKSAFAKLMTKDPVQSSLVDFRAGGNGVPILTRASGSSTAGFQTMGNSRSFTTLGAYRMGDDDGNAPASAIFAGDIFGPHGQPDRVYPERYFPNVGNNTFQPQNNDTATHALLKRMGDQQFKATSMAPFEDYMAQQRLAKDLEEASRNASLSDLGTSREIIRNLAAQRRQQSEDDYLRKMLDAGASPEAAKKEIDDVRNANAIQEAKKVEDRSYQAKMLISRMAMARGVTPMVKEPLNQSSSIDNPQRSQAMSEAMGMPGEGFGTSPLDANRQFLTPDFYKRYLRKTQMSQESADEQGAFNRLLSQGEIQAPPSGAFSMATLRGQERQAQVESVAEGLASRLETLRARGNRIIKPLPKNIIGSQVLDALYNRKGKKVNNSVLYSLETIQDMRHMQLLIALNLAVVNRGFDGIRALKKAISEAGALGAGEVPVADFTNKLKMIVLKVNRNEPNIEIPFVSDVTALPSTVLLGILNEVRASNNETLGRQAQTAMEDYMREVDLSELPVTGDTIQLNRGLVDQSRRASLAPSSVALGLAQNIAQVETPGAPGVARNPDSMSKAELQEALTAKGVSFSPRLGEKKLRKLLTDNP